MINAAMMIFLGKMFIGSFEYRSSSPLNLFPSSMAVQDFDDPGAVTNPSYLPLLKNAYVNFSMEAPYGMEGLSANSISLGAPCGRFGFQGAWRRFGIREYREDLAEAGMGIMPFSWLSFGAGLGYSRISIDSGDVSFGTGVSDFRASMRVMPCRWMTLSCEQDNIRSIVDKNREDLLYPERRFGVSVKDRKSTRL